MERIASFSVDHTTLEKGMYLSRTDGNNIKTYDIRMKKPNADDYISTGAAHTMEHLFATFARNSNFADKVIYVGPMGCRTGFYLIVQDLSEEDTIVLVQDSMAFIASYAGDIPGASVKECGNYLDQDLPAARELAYDMVSILENWSPSQLKYAQEEE